MIATHQSEYYPAALPDTAFTPDSGNSSFSVTDSPIEAPAAGEATKDSPPERSTTPQGPLPLSPPVVFGPLTESESVDAAMAPNRCLPEPAASDSPKKTLHEKTTSGVPEMLAKKVKKEKLEKAKAIRLCSCGESDGESGGLSSIGEASDKAGGKHSLQTMMKETLIKGTTLAEEKFTKEVFDAQGRLLYQRIVIGGPGSGKSAHEKHLEETGSTMKVNGKTRKVQLPLRCPVQLPVQLDGASESENEGSKTAEVVPEAQKAVRFTSTVMPVASDKETDPSAVASTKKSKKSSSTKAPETNDNGAVGAIAPAKPFQVIPKSAREFVTTVLKFVGELEDTTIKSNRMREKNVLNEYRGLVQLFLISQAGFLLAFMILGIVLFNVFALLFVVVLYASR